MAPRPLASLAGVALALAFAGCGTFSNGDCTDKGTCDDGDASLGGDGGSVDGMGGGDGNGGDGTSTGDGAMNQDAPVDVTIDVPRSADGCPLNEICDNGIDDNCDGKVDCADPQCGAYACVGSVPTGWTGPLDVYVALGAPPPAPPPCPTSFPSKVIDGNGDPNAPTPTCGCACGAPTNYLCNSVSISVFSDLGCGTSCVADGLPPNFCVAGCTTPASVTAPLATPQGGICAAQPTTNIAPWLWGRVGRACGLASPALTGGCVGANVCAPKPSSGFSGHLCIEADGDQPCPAGPYSTKQLYYTGATDSRACTQCTCSAPTGGSCTATITAYSDTQCNSAPLGTIAAPSGCQAISASARSYRAGAITLTNGTCGANGGQATGSLMTTGPKTVCCSP